MMTIGFSFGGRRHALGAKRWRFPVLSLLLGALFVASAMMSSSAYADVAVTDCGAPIKSVVKSFYNSSFTTQSTTFVTVTNAEAVVNIPAGQTQCVKVRFFASASCTVSSALDHCYIKAKEPSILDFPPPSITFSSDPALGARSYEWASRLSAGSHTIRIQALASNGTFTLSNWTLSVETAK